MPRHPHHLAPRELARILGEHALGAALVLAGVLAWGLLRDPRVPPLLDLRSWMDPAIGDALGRALRLRWQLLRPELAGHLAWNSFAVATLQYAMALHGLYDRHDTRPPRRILVALLRSAVVAGIVLAVVFFVARPPELGRTALGIGFGLTVLLLWALRSAAPAPRADHVLVLGGGSACRLAADAIAAAGGERFALVGRIGDESSACEGVPSLGGWDALGRVLDAQPVDRLLFASTPPAEWDIGPVVEARQRGVQATTALEFAEGLTGQVVETELGPSFITESTTLPYGRVSRLADVLMALGLLVALAPPCALVALVVLLASGRPVLFRQVRVGRGGEPYACWKFRTMRPDAESAGPAWSPEGDPRVTRVGRFLRRWRLDELPQLWNVLRGDMAFVGPRPEQPYFVARLDESLPFYGLRHVVRPGITGWAQVRHPYGSSEDDARGKLRLDLFYIKHRSPWLDLVILFETVRVVLSGRGR